MADLFERVWGQALTTVSSAEEEVQKLIARVAHDWQPDEVKKQVQQLTERLQQQRKDAERSVEEAVKHTVARLKLPRRDELAQISARLDALAKRVEALTR